jgi:hypothetical protein
MAIINVIYVGLEVGKEKVGFIIVSTRKSSLLSLKLFQYYQNFNFCSRSAEYFEMFSTQFESKR